ncbi:hypothetical protein LITTLEE_138 [Mycobacterium phage LittleE]|uniref:DUF2283 domain-containing protein n=1 Tax=Mycobacterium phage LittleE TaxID=2922212 RepID=G1D423_9CAUD|nr:hypothetical protein FGG27_gp138 [Mycobacterium phage LittleE]AEK09518.1 hypothetical protein LITTLEE_138 [Mycobacterium phage LittleE]ASZ74208.1 hypothetical protein SEA_SQUINT_132 [Mycobacterium phage Squint]QPO16736.1 hypothetical protein SEA_KASHFLOW_132 [Mycobacterium phage KashFlow]
MSYPHHAEDGELGAIYVTLTPNPVVKTVSLDDGAINVDYDADGNAVGVEILL